MALFKTIEELRLFIPVNAGMQLDIINVYLNKIEDEIIIDIISQAQYDNLKAAYLADPTPALSAANVLLLKRCQEVIANLALWKFIEPGTVYISDIITVPYTDQASVVSQSRKEDLKRQFLFDGYNAIEKLLKFLWAAAPGAYALWEASTNKSKYRQLLVLSSEDFNKGFQLRNGYYAYQLLKNAINRVEEIYVAAEISQAYYDELIAQTKANTLTADNLIVVNYLQKAIPPLAVFIALTELGIDIDEIGININSLSEYDNLKVKTPLASSGNLSYTIRRLQEMGDLFLGKLRIYLNAQASAVKYITYFDSNCYKSPETLDDPEQRLNKSDSGVFMA